MCPGTSSTGEACRGRSRGWCRHHLRQSRLLVTCAALRSDGNRCTREVVSDSFCSVASHSFASPCSGYVSFGVPCNEAATESGYCLKHQYQGEGRMCQGKKNDGVKCIAETTGTIYCCLLHDPTFKRFVRPDQLRITINAAQSKEVARVCGYRDAYTKQPIEDEKHVDHVVEHQLAADCISNAWRLRRDHCQSDAELYEVIAFVKNGPANATTNLRDTSAYVNILKGAACKQFIEARHTSDVVQTFTDTLLQANHCTFAGKKLTRETSGAIRKTLKSELKKYWLSIENENDNDLTRDAIVDEFKRLRVAVSA